MFAHEEEKLGKIYDSRIVARLIKYLERDWWMIAVSAFLGILLSVAQIALPIITQRAIDLDIFKVTRLMRLTPSQIKGHENEIYHMRDSLWAVPQQYLSKIPHSAEDEVDQREYYLMDREKAVKNLAPDVAEKYPAVGEDKLLVPYKDLDNANSFPTKVLSVLRQSDWKGLTRLAIFFMLIGVFRFIASFIQVILTTLAGQRSMHRLRTAIFSHLQHLPVRFFDRNPVGRLVTRATNDVDTLNQFFSEVITSFFYDGFILLGLMIALPIYNWRLSLVLFAIVPPMVVATVVFRRRLRDAFRKVRVRIARINAFLNENLSGIKIIQMFRQEAKRIKEFHTINESYYDARFKQMMVFAVFRPLVDFLAMFAMAAIIWFGAHWIVAGVLTVGFLTAFLRFAEIFFEPVRDLTEKFNLLQQAMASGERIFMLLDEKKEDYDGVTIDKKVRGDIEFQNVWFAYNEEEWVLKDISFRIKPGERVAFVGATGAGKTSLINVLSRFYEIQKGRILLDGKDTKDIDKKFLRSNVGIVMQDVFLFLGDIETNIKLRSELPQEIVESAARTTNASQFISKLPDTYKSPVQERGVNLSVGERQLISFARALAFDPAILVLDEATSSVDTKTEALIQDAIHKLLEGRTSLIIAHRLSTVRDADRIIVLDHGKIVEEGSHEELMARKDFYYGLYKLQFEHKIS
ncbi:ABC transporter ATP-binding protein [bacterium]|nr:ABC transporter ATP-binding protein [bacterium]